MLQQSKHFVLGSLLLPHSVPPAAAGLPWVVVAVAVMVGWLSVPYSKWGLSLCFRSLR